MKDYADGDLDGLSIVNPVSKTITAFPEALSNFWEHKGLIRNFTSRDISQRYRNSIAGYFWTVLEPLLLSAVYYFLFTILRDTTDDRLPLWIILGVITWQYFSKGLNASINSLTGNKNMIKQIYFPRELFAVSKVMSQLVVTVMSLVVAIPFMIHLGIQPTWQLLFAPIALLLVTLQVLGVGWMFAV